LAVLLVIAGGCTGTTGHLAAMSTIDVSLEDLVDAPPPHHAIGKSYIRVVGVFPTGLPNFGDALSEALSKSGGTFVTSATVRYEIRYVPFIYGWACYVVEGDVR
jgi:hypothetical protein